MVLCGDNVEDDTGGYAVFTEQAAPASHKTAGKVVDTMLQVWRSKRCCFRVQAKISDASRLLKLPETECPTVWVQLPRQRRPELWDDIDDSMVP